jgi:hypothetical protein
MRIADVAADMSVRYDRLRVEFLTEFCITSSLKSRLKTPDNHMTSEVSMAMNVVSISQNTSTIISYVYVN